jgi:hypothetical protein
MTLKFTLIALISMVVLSCTNLDNHQFKVEKNAESVNGIKFTVSLIGSDLVECKGIVKYNNVILHQFTIKSYPTETPKEFLINYSEFPQIAQQLAIDFVLNRKPSLEILIQNKEKEFFRSGYLELNPKTPPIMTGIELNDKDITKRYPLGLKREIYEIEAYFGERNVRLTQYTLEKIATVSLLIQNNSKVLPTIIPEEEKTLIYKGLKNLGISVSCDSDSMNPQLVLYPSTNNKYYDGPDLYKVAQTIYSEHSKDLTSVRFKGNKYLLEKNFYVQDLIGEYELYLIISNNSNDYFFYDLGSVIFDNVAPEFDKWVFGGYYFWGNELYEGKVYLDYSIPFSRNPYEVIFSGMVYGDVEHLSVDGKQIDVKKDSDILFTKKIYIEDGYKDVNIKVTDSAGNLKSYTLPLIVSH